MGVYGVGDVVRLGGWYMGYMVDGREGAYVSSRRESRVIFPDWEAVEVVGGECVIPSRAAAVLGELPSRSWPTLTTSNSLSS